MTRVLVIDDEGQVLHEGMTGGAWVSFVVRGGQLVPITGDTRLRAGDDVLILAPSELGENLTTAFEGPAAE